MCDVDFNHFPVLARQGFLNQFEGCIATLGREQDFDVFAKHLLAFESGEFFKSLVEAGDVEVCIPYDDRRIGIIEKVVEVFICFPNRFFHFLAFRDILSYTP